MKNLILRGFCILLAILTLALCITSCKKDGGDDERVSATGEIGADAVKDAFIVVWKGDGTDLTDLVSFKSDEENPYERLKTTLGGGGLVNTFSFGLKNVKELDGKTISKVSFELEADRAVTLTVAAKYSTSEYCTKPIILEVNKPQKIEIEIGASFKRDSSFGVDFWRVGESYEEEHYFFKTDEFKEWSKTEYKITDFKLFCE